MSRSESESEPTTKINTTHDPEDQELNKKIERDGFPSVLLELSTLEKMSFLAQIWRLTQSYAELVKLAQKANKPELVKYLIKHTEITQKLLDKTCKKMQISIANNT